MNPEPVIKIIESQGGKTEAGLISILEDIQSEYSYLPEEALKIVAQKTGRSLVDIYGVATFYKAFSLKPRGKHLISVCLGTACHVRGGQSIASELQRQLGIRAGETTPDHLITLETVNCLGACALAPLVRVDQRNYGKFTADRIQKIVKEYRPDGEGKSHGND